MGGPKRPRLPSPKWRDESEALREILSSCGLTERIKWGSLCYTFEGKNIAIIQEMKAYLALMFFKGALLEDPEGLLEKPGPNSHAGRRLEFTAASDIIESAAAIDRFVRQAIEIEKAGLKVPEPAKPESPPELRARFERDPSLEAAFDSLTPGRQRGYTIYFSAPKSAEARERRIDRYADKILAGKGFHDR